MVLLIPGAQIIQAILFFLYKNYCIQYIYQITVSFLERLASGKFFWPKSMLIQRNYEIILRDNLVRFAARKVCLMFLQNLTKRTHLIYIVKLLENRHWTYQLAHPS